MLVQLILATAMVATTVLIYLFGLALLIRALRSHTRAFRKLTIMPLTLLLVATIGIFMIHTLEIWLYALLTCCSEHSPISSRHCISPPSPMPLSAMAIC